MGVKTLQNHEHPVRIQIVHVMKLHSFHPSSMVSYGGLYVKTKHIASKYSEKHAVEIECSIFFFFSIFNPFFEKEFQQ